jgi:hypothetical protein
MISHGEHSISKHLRLLVESQADESFCAQVAVGLSDLPEAPQGWAYAPETAVALKIKGYCDPHSDDFMGNGERPTKHASLFWLFKDTSRRPSHLMAGNQSCKLLPGQWAMFDDSLLHAFLAEGTWIGIAIQLRALNN